LKNGNMTVENISHAVGYQNVENFSRQFKKNFQMTPVQYRNQNRVS
jgi:2-isopropylmalate synthase